MASHAVLRFKGLRRSLLKKASVAGFMFFLSTKPVVWAIGYIKWLALLSIYQVGIFWNLTPARYKKQEQNTSDIDGLARTHLAIGL